MTNRRSLALRGIQYALGLIALVWLVRQTDWRQLIELLADLSSVVVAALFAVTCLEFVSRFSMWYSLTNVKHRTSFTAAARIDLVIKFVNHVIPSRVSGHSLAPAVVYHCTDHDWSESVGAAGTHTGVYALLYGTFSGVGLVLFADRLPYGVLLLVALSTAVYVVVAAVILFTGRNLDTFSGVPHRLSGLVKRLPYLGKRVGALMTKLPSLASDSAAAFRSITDDRRALVLYASAWTGTLMVFPAVRVWVLLSAASVSFTPAWLLPLALVVGYSVTVLPITPGGVGVAEASASLVFIALGIPESVAVSVIVVDRFLGVYLPAVVGWYPVARLDFAELALDRT